NTAQDYTGTVRITTTDPGATLPGLSGMDGVGQATFTSRHLGTRFIPFSVSFKATGRHTVTVEDAANPARVITGKATVVVSSSTGPLVQRLTVTSPPQNGTVNGASVTVEGATQPYTNIQVKGGVQPATGESDDAGRFAIAVPLDPAYNEFTLLVTDDGGGEVTLHLVRDTDPPVITAAKLSPERPQEGENVLLVVQSEPALKGMELKLGDERIPLQEDSSRPGTYQALFTAPRGGEYQPAVEAKDQAGNTANLLVPLAVTARKLAVLTNLRAQPKNGAVELQWDPAEEAVDLYRVYVGEKPGEYAYTLETPDASRSAATVTGLSTGMPYVFAVTAVQGDRESEKSIPVSAHVLGVLLEVTPQDEALAVEWSLPVDITFQSFLVEYGAEPDRMTEKRTVPGGDIKAEEKRALVLRDLLPGITYFVRITPVDTTGEAREDLVATGQGTPGGDGAHYAAPDQIPPFQEDPDFRPPRQTGSGLPHLSWWIAGSVALFLLLLQWHSRRKLRRAHQFLRMMESRYHR
ncbi:MAG: fibronectin type III domain-containing protein, partial [Patescibacteria group bacterium]